MEVKALCEREAEGWAVEIPEFKNLHLSAKRLDKVEAMVKEAAKNYGVTDTCDVVIKIIATMPGIICDMESAQEKMKLASKLQDEASQEIREVVKKMREQGLTMRDIAVLLGVTPQRVAQLSPCD
jgi:DNA-directed RNA polymerase specialized sigma subunit